MAIFSTLHPKERNQRPARPTTHHTHRASLFPPGAVRANLQAEAALAGGASLLEVVDAQMRAMFGDEFDRVGDELVRLGGM